MSQLTTPAGHTITKLTKMRVGSPISGMYSNGGGSCLGHGTITAVSVNEQYSSRRYRVTVEFPHGLTREYSNVRPNGESDYTGAIGTCDGCGHRDGLTWLQYRHTC